MRLDRLAALLLLCASLLVACGQKESAPTGPQVPTSTDTKAWQGYVREVLKGRLDPGARPFVTLIPADKEPTDYLQNTKDFLGRGVAQGTVLVFVSPDSAKAAELVLQAFAEVAPGSLQKVQVIFIGKEADRARVEAAVTPSGAIYTFIATG
jgi:ADP-heptose:LPS heptosyltransferase